MSKKNSYSEFWKSHDKRAQERAREVYPLLHRIYKWVFALTCVVWMSYIILPPLFANVYASYAGWGPVYEKWTLIASFVMLIVYVVVNMTWQKKVGKFHFENKN